MTRRRWAVLLGSCVGAHGIHSFTHSFVYSARRSLFCLSKVNQEKLQSSSLSEAVVINRPHNKRDGGPHRDKRTHSPALAPRSRCSSALFSLWKRTKGWRSGAAAQLRKYPPGFVCRRLVSCGSLKTLRHKTAAGSLIWPVAYNWHKRALLNTVMTK